MKVMLKTLCGCTKEVDTSLRAYIYGNTISISFPLETIEYDSIGKPHLVDVKPYSREFKYNGGRNSKGLPIYVEVWKGY